MKKPQRPPRRKTPVLRKVLGSHRLAGQHKVNSQADKLSKTTHFSLSECRALIHLHQNLEASAGALMDRMRMREVLHIVFQITDEVMLDLAFKAFDKDGDGYVDELEWVAGMSIMLRGTTEELSDWCYYIYDINGDGGLAREELSHCLKGCIFHGYGIEPDEIDDCERDIVEIAMKKLDVDLDGQISIYDFKKAVRHDPLMLVSCGPCLPTMRSCAAFLSLVTQKYRVYTGPLGRDITRKKQGGWLGGTTGQGGRFGSTTTLLPVPSLMSNLTDLSELSAVAFQPPLRTSLKLFS